MAHAARPVLYGRFGAGGKSASTGTPVSVEIATAKDKEGVAFPAFIFVIMERSHPTFSARMASVFLVVSKYIARDVIR